jgi:CDP-diacylglycerol--glycerol-3-phosphate 3-phosphatidyltransferase
VLAVLSEYAAVLPMAGGGARRNDGPMGKSDRAFAFGALGLWAGVGSPAFASGDVALALIALALVITIVNRVRGGLLRKHTA